MGRKLENRETKTIFQHFLQRGGDPTHLMLLSRYPLLISRSYIGGHINVPQLPTRLCKYTGPLPELPWLEPWAAEVGYERKGGLASLLGETFLFSYFSNGEGCKLPMMHIFSNKQLHISNEVFEKKLSMEAAHSLIINLPSYNKSL